MDSKQSIANEKDVLRIIDANANRVREGLRVIEEFCRFTLEDESLTEQVKRLRHEVTAAVTLVAKDKTLLASRDSADDVGAESLVESENKRTSMADVVAASFKRVEEGLRGRCCTQGVFCPEGVRGGLRFR